MFGKQAGLASCVVLKDENCTQSFQASSEMEGENYTFGDFDLEELSIGGVKDAVEFLYDSRNISSTISWVEEGKKHNFGIKPPDDIDKKLIASNGNPVPENHVNQYSQDKSDEKDAPSCLSYHVLEDVAEESYPTEEEACQEASLFQISDSLIQKALDVDTPQLSPIPKQSSCLEDDSASTISMSEDTAEFSCSLVTTSAVSDFGSSGNSGNLFMSDKGIVVNGPSSASPLTGSTIEYSNSEGKSNLIAAEGSQSDSITATKIKIETTTTDSKSGQPSPNTSTPPAQPSPKSKTSSWASLFKSSATTTTPESTPTSKQSPAHPANQPVTVSINSEPSSSQPGTPVNKPTNNPIDFPLPEKKVPNSSTSAVPVAANSVPTNRSVSTWNGNSANNHPLNVIAHDEDPKVLKLAEFISGMKANYNRHNLQLRGLVNRSNWCYINANLQALLGIPAFTRFYKDLKSLHNPRSSNTSTPLTDCMIAFFDEFDQINPRISLKKQTEDIRAGTPFEPNCVFDVLPAMKTTLSEKGRQQDAEEFLTFMLDGIHEELSAMQKIASKQKQQEEGEHIHMNGNATDDKIQVTTPTHEKLQTDEQPDAEEWEHVGPKNKTANVRSSTIKDSLIKDVFGGVIRSSVHQTGAKESATLQAFFTLQLDIQSDKIWTLSEAIEHYFTKENLQGFTCSKTNAEVEASRRSTLEELPNVFIFHLKYFVFGMDGCEKLHKPITIPIDLDIPKDILSPSLKVRSQPQNRKYKLFAVVYHHGKNAAGGHYTSAVHHGHPFGWVRFDDHLLKPVAAASVTKHQKNQVPYLLFYERLQPNS